MTPRIYLPELAAHASEAPIRLSPEAFHHAVIVLRLKDGSPLELFDGHGNFALARLSDIEKKSANALLTGAIQLQIPTALHLHLVQGLALGDKMDWVIEKAVELGVSRITPWTAERSQLRLTPERAEKRWQHWQQVAIAACMQSGQNYLPRIDPPTGLLDILAAAKLAPDTPMSDIKISALIDVFGAPSESATGLTELHLKHDSSLRLWIGPEAGISQSEVKQLLKHHAKAVYLGPRILRTETAGLAALAGVQALAGDWKIRLK